MVWTLRRICFFTSKRYVNSSLPYTLQKEQWFNRILVFHTSIISMMFRCPKGQKMFSLKWWKPSSVLHLTSRRRSPPQGCSYSFYYHIQFISNSSTSRNITLGRKLLKKRKHFHFLILINQSKARFDIFVYEICSPNTNEFKVDNLFITHNQPYMIMYQEQKKEKPILQIHLRCIYTCVL